jgi:hypothetical protein
MGISAIRDQIYDHFQVSQKCQDFFFLDENEDRYSGYYTSMYLIQDTTEALQAHRIRGFSSDPLEAYIEVWGVLQALYIQQDAIAELYRSIADRRLNTSSITSWKELRGLRNTCAGHPARKDRPTSQPVTRTFLGRHLGTYSAFQYEQWKSPDEISHPTIDLGALIDDYETEATGVMQKIHKLMSNTWPV